MEYIVRRLVLEKKPREGFRSRRIYVRILASISILCRDTNFSPRLSRYLLGGFFFSQLARPVEFPRWRIARFIARMSWKYVIALSRVSSVGVCLFFLVLFFRVREACEKRYRVSAISRRREGHVSSFLSSTIIEIRFVVVRFSGERAKRSSGVQVRSRWQVLILNSARLIMQVFSAWINARIAISFYRASVLA